MPARTKVFSKNITVEDAQIKFRNFTGKEGKFNAEGRRNFCVFLEEEHAKNLKRLGWNIKYLDPREDGDPIQAYLQVSVNYKNLPPKIVVITSNGKTILDEDTVNILDWAEIEHVDLIIRPYEWDVNGKQGIKAYVKTMYVAIVEDEVEKKYRNVPDAAIKNLVPPDDEED